MRRTPAATAALGDDDERSDVAGRSHVSAAAQFHAETRHGDDANLVAILFAEEGHGAALDGLVGGAHLRLHGGIADDLLVDDLLDAIDLVRT
jgi:hypothetical protein